MDEADSGTDVLQFQIDEVLHETNPEVRAEKMMVMGNEHRNMLFEVDLTIGKTVKHRWISPGEAHKHDEQMSQGNSAMKMEQTFKNHGVITEVMNFETNEDREKFMQEYQMRRDTDIGFTGCYIVPQQKVE